MLEEKIAEQFAKMLMFSTQDQWGNTQKSPVESALDKFVKDNEEELIKQVLKVLTVEKIAEEVAKKLEENIKYLYGPSYTADEIKKSLKSEIGQHLAKKIADDLKI